MTGLPGRPRREVDSEGKIKCAFCGLFKHENEFFRRDSYCNPCRKQYAREYNARRKAEDPKYLARKAARAKLMYRTDEIARARRLDAAAKYRSKLRHEDELRQKGRGPKPEPKPEPLVVDEDNLPLTPRQVEQEAKRKAEEAARRKWSDV